MAYVKASEREEQIVAAAIRVLSEVGVPGTTLRAVAAEAGIPLGTLHYVFPAKDQMLRAVVSTVTNEVSDTARAGLELDQGVAHALRQGIVSFWNHLVEGRIGLQIMQYELAMNSLRTEGSQGLVRMQYERYTSLITEFCEQAANAAGERCAVDFETLGRLTLAVVDGVLLQYVASPDADRAHRDLERAIDMIIELADPRPVASASASRPT